ncbi:MAG: outer membrane beta-barrel protein [Bacteroidaceae bacterium]|jgi:hypothetical protein|nr:outer membrane beta-barrel protein [Bacteroidaceae bacterium]
MKKLLFLAAVLLTAGAASAQITYSLGYISTSTKAEYTLGGITSSKTTSMNGLTISVDDNINLTGDLNVAPGVGMDFSMRKDGDIKYKKFGLYVPVDFNYGFALSSNLKLFVYAGPTFDLGIIKDAKDDNGNKVNYYDKDLVVNYSRFDLLLGGGAWLTFQDQLRFKVGYKVGMLNTCKADNYTVKNNVLSVSVGYIF